MTKLVVVLAVVVVVILVVVIVAVRNMRAEDPDEYADRPGPRGGMRDNRNGRDPRYDRSEPPARHPGRGNARGGRPAGRQAGGGNRPAGASARGYDERMDRRGLGYDQEPGDVPGYDDDRRFDQRPARGAATAPGPDARRRGANGTQRRPEESLPPARTRQARGRRSGDSSEWDSSEWEKLSDVDYWAELASDKPLTTTAQPAAPSAARRPPAQARDGRSRPDRAPGAPAGRGPADSMPGASVPAGAPRRDPATGLPVRGRMQPAGGELPGAGVGRADFAAAPVQANPAGEQLHPLAEPRSSGARHSGPASLPRPVHSLRQDRPAPERPAPERPRPDRRPVDPDDDPLTSPSFPRVPASDSRSYHNGRASTPARGSRAPEQYLAPTQQFSSYDSPVAPPPAQPPAAPHRHTGPQRQAAQHSADRVGDTERTNPNAYRPDPLASRGDPYPPRSASVPPAAASNPYGSYVTPGSQPAVPGYGGYPPVPGNGYVNGNGNGHGSYPPPAAPAGTDYWQHQQAPAPEGYPGPGGPVYPNGSAPVSDPRHAARAADYGNGYGRHGQAGYPPNGYPAAPDPGYAPADPYGPDEYGGYPGYGTAER
jgi:hypothetical protein